MRVRNWCTPWPYTLLPHTHAYIFLGDFLSFSVQYSALLHLPPLRFHCADGCWDRTQDRCARKLSMHISFPKFSFCIHSAGNWCVHWACMSGPDAYRSRRISSETGACTEHMHQVLMRAQSTVPSKHAEHKHQELMRPLSIWVRNWCGHIFFSIWGVISLQQNIRQTSLSFFHILFLFELSFWIKIF